MNFEKLQKHVSQKNLDKWINEAVEELEKGDHDQDCLCNEHIAKVYRNEYC